MMRAPRTCRDKIVASVFSVTLQFALGLLLGHQYDMGIFFTAGYAVSKGLSPYGLFPARAIFGHPGLFEELPGIGYPPLWALYLGLTYLSVYNPTGNIFAYNLAIKLPSIASNIALAFIAEKIAAQEGVSEKDCRKVFYFFLFNPFMIYISAVWGQFDSLVILTSILATNALFCGNTKRSAFFLALSSSLKIIPLILAPMFMLFIKRKQNNFCNFQFILTVLSTLIVFSYIPFIIFGWNPNMILSDPSFHFHRAGGLSFYNVLELLLDTTTLPRSLDALGYLWIPALSLGYYLLSKTPLTSRMDLLRWASSLLFILMLSRTWVSEQNIILLIPLVLLHTVVNFREWTIVQLAWIVTFVFTIINGSIFQMFFLLSPVPYNLLKAFDQTYMNLRFIVRFITVIPWSVLGWTYVKRTIQSR